MPVTSTRTATRKTRNSVVKGELDPPYEVKCVLGYADNLVHSFGRVLACNTWDSCCRLQLAGITLNDEAPAPTCVHCIVCKGCHACKPNHIRFETMRMGKWETSDHRKLYPFEMDAIHLMNAIAKLRREQVRFKADYVHWIDVLETEAGLRGLIPRLVR